MCTYVHMYVYMYACMRERDRETEMDKHIYISIYIYILNMYQFSGLISTIVCDWFFDTISRYPVKYWNINIIYHVYIGISTNYWDAPLKFHYSNYWWSYRWFSDVNLHLVILIENFPVSNVWLPGSTGPQPGVWWIISWWNSFPYWIISMFKFPGDFSFGIHMGSIRIRGWDYYDHM